MAPLQVLAPVARRCRRIIQRNRGKGILRNGRRAPGPRMPTGWRRRRFYLWCRVVRDRLENSTVAGLDEAEISGHDL